MHDLKKARQPIILRRNMGSMPVVSAVYAYDPDSRQAACRMREADGWQRLELLGLGELEALDANGEFVETELVVRRMAREIVKQPAQFV